MVQLHTTTVIAASSLLYNRNSITIAYGFNFFPNYERKDIDLVRRYNTYTTIW